MNIPALNLIKAYHGYAYETAGFISAFFRDAKDARNCARKLNRFVEANDRFLRQFMANATPIEPDGANRILLPKRLCEFANIDREVLIVSMVSDFEIWDPKTYQEMEQKQDRNEFLRLSELTMGDHPTNE
jgi:MraZ protein